jgi:hypothetical protein
VVDDDTVGLGLRQPFALTLDGVALVADLSRPYLNGTAHGRHALRVGLLPIDRQV